MKEQQLLHIKFSKWNPDWASQWSDGLQRQPNSTADYNLNKRCDKTEFKISAEHLESHEENLKWEFEQTSQSLNEIRKRKFIAINASMVMFPGLVGALAAITTMNELSLFTESMQWVAVLIVSIFIGLANMIAIKYIAAFKSQSTLAIRQINCLRQALDSITYFKFEGKFPIHLKALAEGSIYFKTFGKHRKFPVGNEGFRNRFIDSFSVSADKSLIGFLYLTSVLLVGAPFIYWIAVSYTRRDSLFASLSGYSHVFIALTLFIFIVGVFAFVFAHWTDFKYLGKDEEEEVRKNQKELPFDILFCFNKFDCIPIALFAITGLFWVVVGLSQSKTIFSIIILSLTVVSTVILIASVHKVFFDSLNRINKSLITKSCFKS